MFQFVDIYNQCLHYGTSEADCQHPYQSNHFPMQNALISLKRPDANNRIGSSTNNIPVDQATLNDG